MRNRTGQLRAFTLIELILVMMLMTIIAAEVVPLLHNFTMGRRTSNVASRILNMTQYAHTEAISEGRVYRLNLDPNNGQYWLTAENNGQFVSPGSDYEQKSQIDSNMKLQVDIATPVIPVTEQDTQLNLGLNANNSRSAQLSPTAQDVEFQPSGRTDPAHIILSDNLGTKIEIACTSPTELFRILPKDEMTR